jgi:hypothetical protein
MVCKFCTHMVNEKCNSIVCIEENCPHLEVSWSNLDKMVYKGIGG